MGANFHKRFTFSGRLFLQMIEFEHFTENFADIVFFDFFFFFCFSFDFFVCYWFSVLKWNNSILSKRNVVLTCSWTKIEQIIQILHWLETSQDLNFITTLRNSRNYFSHIWSNLARLNSPKKNLALGTLLGLKKFAFCR